jgi:hypothetical protein
LFGRSNLLELDEESQIEALSDDAVHIAAFLESLPAPNMNADQPSNPFQYVSLDLSSAELSPLIDLRLGHQTKQAYSGICKATTGHMRSQQQKILTERQSILRELQGIVKEQEEIGAGTGLERAARWTGQNPAAGG